MIPLEIEQIFDEPIKQLFDEAKLNYSISFEPWENDFWRVHTKNKDVVINYNIHDINPESLAHELLHIWVKKYGHTSINYLKNSFASHSFLSKVFDIRLCEHIGNCMDHLKMYPKYKEMGYSDKGFIWNGGKPQCKISDIKQIYFKVNGQYSDTGVNQYIGHSISILADHCPNDYTKEISLLRKIDRELFEVVLNFWNEWVEFDIENIDSIYNSDLDLLDRFVGEVENWFELKKSLHKRRILRWRELFIHI